MNIHAKLQNLMMKRERQIKALQNTHDEIAFWEHQLNADQKASPLESDKASGSPQKTR